MAKDTKLMPKKQVESATGSGHTKEKGSPMFWVIEGIDGAGKGAVIEGLVAGTGLPPLVTSKEPSATPLGQQLKQFICSPNSPRAKMLFAIGLMNYHWNTIVEPALLAKKLVLCDRHYPSTVAYQLQETEGGHLDLLQKLIDDDLLKYISPPSVIVIDVPGEVAVERLWRRSQQDVDWYDQQIETMEQIRQNYLDYAPVYKWQIVDGTRPLAEVISEVKSIIVESLGKTGSKADAGKSKKE